MKDDLNDREEEGSCPKTQHGCEAMSKARAPGRRRVGHLAPNGSHEGLQGFQHLASLLGLGILLCLTQLHSKLGMIADGHETLHHIRFALDAQVRGPRDSVALQHVEEHERKPAVPPESAR